MSIVSNEIEKQLPFKKDSAHKRRHKKERSHQSYKYLLEKQKSLEKKSEDKPQTSSTQEQASANEEDANLLSKKVSVVLKKALDKKAKRVKMSSKESKSREEVVAAREAKKLAKQKFKNKEPALSLDDIKAIVRERKKSTSECKDDKPGKERTKSHSESTEKKSNDEVDKVAQAPGNIEPVLTSTKGMADKDKELIQAERAAKKAAKQAHKKGKAAGDDAPSSRIDQDMTVKDVVEALRDIKEVANDVKGITAEVKALDLRGKKNTDEKIESERSKAELKADRRAKQEAQRAAKQAATEASKPKEPATKPLETPKKIKLGTDAKIITKAVSSKSKTVKKVPQQNRHRVSWFGQEYNDTILTLKGVPVNSHIHPAFIKLGIQLSTKVVFGSNARCIALLDALKKMTKDYMLPAKTEFSRGLDSHLTETMDFLASVRQPSASEINAIKFYRHHLTQLPNNVNEYEAKKTLQDEMERYIREQIDVAGEAISADIRKKISPGDVIVTYGYSSLVERCLLDAHAAGAAFSCAALGARGAPSARGAAELARRLRARGLRVLLADVSSLASLMQTVDLVVLGATSVLNNGAVLGAAGTALVARLARARHVPVLVACETHKFSERVLTDAFVYNELDDPDNLNDAGKDWVLKDWRSMPLAILNLAYDVTPASFVTAVVTELAILPCTSAPVVLRFRGTAYGI